jgi:hypothetical protein
VEKLKERWAPLAAVTLPVVPLVKGAGWAAELLMHATGEAAESLHGKPYSALAPLVGELGQQERP